MISQLWTNVSLEDYNKWFPLTGTIKEVPDKYQTFYSDVNHWFTAFALRAQNDINAYLDFILYKFPFDSYKDPLIQETLVDMVFIMIEHWVFNRIPIESLTDVTTQFNNGINLNSQSTPTLNIFDLAPSRMKNLAQLTELKQLIYSYQDQEVDATLIDLGAFYNRMQVDALLKTEQDVRLKGDQDNHQFTLDKQMKLYDEVIKDGNDTEVLRGPITKFINKGYVSTNYDPATETMILDWPSEIGTLPPETLQPNPQEGDVTHAPTADFTAKLQKRITTNENNLKHSLDSIDLLNNTITANTNLLTNIKNNYFALNCNPLWKKVENLKLNYDKWHKVYWEFGNKFGSTFKVSQFLVSSKNSASPWGFFTVDTIHTKFPAVGDEYFLLSIFNHKLDIHVTSIHTDTYAQILEVYEYQNEGIPL